MDGPTLSQGNFVPQARKRPRSSRIKEHAWEGFKPELHELYKSHTVLDIMSIMKERHDFKASKRQYGYRFEKWGWRKYGEKRDPTLPPTKEESSGDQADPSLLHPPLSRNHLSAIGYASNPFLNVPPNTPGARTLSNASETSATSENASFVDDTDADDAVSTSGTLVPPIFYPWAAQGDATKLKADFLTVMTDAENAFYLYTSLNDNLSTAPELYAAAKNMIVTSLCRLGVDQPKNAKQAREILLRHRATVTGTSHDQPFLFSMLEAILEHQEDHLRRNAIDRRICEVVKNFLVNSTTLHDMPSNYSAIDLMTRRLLRYGLDVYDEAFHSGDGQVPTFSKDELVRQYVCKQPINDIIQHGGGSILRECVTWCARQLNLNCKIPDEIASIPCDHRRVPWYDDIKLFCSLWHAMLVLVQNNTPPPWYVPCESALGISPSELLVTVCWVIGYEARGSGPNDIHQRARMVVDAMIRWTDRKLWDKFFEIFDWMNQPVDIRGDDEAFDKVVIQHIRRYISATLGSPLPISAEEVVSNSSLPSESMDLDGGSDIYGYSDALPVMGTGYE